MPVEAIVEKILSDAKEEAEAIRASFLQEVEKLEEGKSQEIEKIRVEVDREGKLRGEEAVRRLLSSKQMEAKKSILQLKQELIDRVFESAYDKVYHLKDQEYREFIQALLQKVVETGDEEVIVGKRDAKRITSSFIQAVNRELKKMGREGKLLLGPPSPEIDRGFILRRGRKEINVALSALFASVRQELESETAEVLFGEDG